MIRSAESSLTKFALKRFVPRVFPRVSAQLVRSCKPPATIFPGADERFLPRVSSQVSFQVRGFRISFATSGERTSVDQNFLGDPSPPPLDLGWKYSGRLLQVLAVMKRVVPVCGGEGRGQGGVRVHVLSLKRSLSLSLSLSNSHSLSTLLI